MILSCDRKLIDLHIFTNTVVLWKHILTELDCSEVYLHDTRQENVISFLHLINGMSQIYIRNCWNELWQGCIDYLWAYKSATVFD